MKKIKLVVWILAISSLDVLTAQTIPDGLKYLENENYTEAEKTFKTLADKEPTNPIYQYYIGEVKYQLEDYTAAEQAYKEGLKISTKCSECNIGIARIKLDQGKIIEAQLIFDAVIKSNKKNAFIPALIGKAFLTSKKPIVTKAIEYLTKSRDMEPKVASTLTLLGNSYKQNNDLGNAMTNYEISVELDPNNLEAVMSMARIWASSKQSERAVKNLENALKLKPDYAPAYKDLYELYIRDRKFDQALPLLESYVKLAGDDVDAKVRLVKYLCYTAKDYNRAILEGQKILATNPEQYTLHRWMAWSAGELEKYQECYESSLKLFAAVKTDPSRKLFASDTAYYAKSVFAVGKLDEAEIIYEQLVIAFPVIALETYDKFAKNYYAQKNYEKAIKFYHLKNTIKPINSSDLVYLGLAQINMNKLVDADSSFARALAMNPNYPYGWSRRIMLSDKIAPDTVSTARTWVAKPLHEKYIEYAAAAFIADPEKNKPYKSSLINSYNYLGYYYSQQEASRENTDLAKMNFEKVLVLDPNDQMATQAMTVYNNSSSIPSKKAN